MARLSKQHFKVFLKKAFTKENPEKEVLKLADQFIATKNEDIKELVEALSLLANNSDEETLKNARSVLEKHTPCQIVYSKD